MNELIFSESGIYLILVLKIFLSQNFILGTPFRVISSQFNIPKTVLQKHDTRESQDSEVEKRNWKTAFADEEELSLKESIVKLAKLGFAPR